MKPPETARNWTRCRRRRRRKNFCAFERFHARFERLFLNFISCTSYSDALSSLTNTAEHTTPRTRPKLQHADEWHVDVRPCVIKCAHCAFASTRSAFARAQPPGTCLSCTWLSRTDTSVRARSGAAHVPEPQHDPAAAARSSHARAIEPYAVELCAVERRAVCATPLCCHAALAPHLRAAGMAARWRRQRL